MQTSAQDLVKLENRFWQSLVDEDADTATHLLDEPSMLVSGHGVMTFDRATYRRMAEQSPMVVKSFSLRDVNVAFPNDDTAVVTYQVAQSIAKRGQDKETRQEMTDSSVWVRKGGEWRCAMHTETPLEH